MAGSGAYYSLAGSKKPKRKKSLSKGKSLSKRAPIQRAMTSGGRR